MKRIYEKKEFEQVAATATRAAPQEVDRKFRVPIVGTLTCTFAGTAKPDQEFIVWDTQVTFEWRLRNPHVQGVVSQQWMAHEAMHMVPKLKFLPFRLKRPLVAAFLYKVLSAGPLPDMRMPASMANSKLQLHAIAVSKPITELPFRKTVLKRRHGGTIEVPICARVDDKRSLAVLPNEVGTRTLFGFQHNKFRCIVDDETRKKMTIDSATHAKVLELPAEASAYDKRPWRCLRDVVAASHFKAEELRAQAEGRAVDIDRAMAGLVVCPFAWDSTEDFGGQTVFIIFTSGEKSKVQFHFKSANLKRLCMLVDAAKKKKKKKKASRAK
jgi:hypothetical protein